MDVRSSLEYRLGGSVMCERGPLNCEVMEYSITKSLQHSHFTGHTSHFRSKTGCISPTCQFFGGLFRSAVLTLRVKMDTSS